MLHKSHVEAASTRILELQPDSNPLLICKGGGDPLKHLKQKNADLIKVFWSQKSKGQKWAKHGKTIDPQAPVKFPCPSMPMLRRPWFLPGASKRSCASEPGQTWPPRRTSSGRCQTSAQRPKSGKPTTRGNQGRGSCWWQVASSSSTDLSHQTLANPFSLAQHHPTSPSQVACQMKSWFALRSANWTPRTWVAHRVSAAARAPDTKSSKMQHGN